MSPGRWSSPASIICPAIRVQLYESLCYLLIFLIQFRYYRKHGNAGPEGYLFCRFLILVFGARFAMEFFKEGQAAFETGWIITMGQWLSIPAVMFGGYMVWRAQRLEPARASGLRRYYLRARCLTNTSSTRSCPKK